SNPDKARARARVFNPDGNRARRISAKSPVIPLSSFDLHVTPDGGAVLIHLSELGGEFLLDDTSWTLSLMVSDWSNSKTVEVPNSTNLDLVDETIRISANYSDILSIIGPRDPGVMDLYATRPSLGDEGSQTQIKCYEPGCNSGEGSGHYRGWYREDDWHHSRCNEVIGANL
ncbi:hypothetical protein EBV26_17145, partial [bacterium]|nr:hypothetical protein [bacterium]